MPQAALTFFALVLLCVGATARGEEAEGVYFQHGDWEIACDNTLTCRIAGYYSGGDGGSVLITRAAGPDAPLEGKVTLLVDYRDEESLPENTLTLRIDGKAKGKLKNPREGNFSLTSAQIHALLAAVRRDGTVEFVGKDDAKSFTLSGKGISAVLLKADEAQGRIGTPGAFIRKGDKPEESVFPPRLAPVIRAAKVSKAPSRQLTAPEIAALQPLLLRSARENCPAFNDPEEIKVLKIDWLELEPLDERRVLVSTLCWRGASDSSSVYWMVDSAFKEAPKLVNTDITGYHKGVLYSVFGKQTCGGGSKWVWDGQEFRLSETWTTGMCRGFVDNTWHLPTYVTDIINADGTPRAPE
jgi:hypothetical protein